MITKFSEKLVGTTVWYFHPKDGVQHVTITGIYHTRGRRGTEKWGIMYDYQGNKGGIHTKTLWAGDYAFFESRRRCEKYVKALLEKSDAERIMDKAMGWED